jgi:hypothetical protein
MRLTGIHTCSLLRARSVEREIYALDDDYDEPDYSMDPTAPLVLRLIPHDTFLFVFASEFVRLVRVLP